jgi:pimeloyl-ACP methyl ester carboxylesterase
MAYWEWGDPHNPRVVVCVHGLTRQGRDFDTLARDLCGDFRVVCPDVLGRGHSEWLADPAGYAVPAYAADMVTLLARLDVDEVNWVGTSMGGLIGMALASVRGIQIQRMVLNDVGPVLELAALQRIGRYVGQPIVWPSQEAAAAALWQVSQGFGPHTAEQWLALTRPQLRAHPDGGWHSHYDPRIGLAFQGLNEQTVALGEAALWAAYDALSCETLLLRGADSDLLSPATAKAMSQRGPRARVVTFDGVGHAPTLVQADQRAVVRQFLGLA